MGFRRVFLALEFPGEGKLREGLGWRIEELGSRDPAQEAMSWDSDLDPDPDQARNQHNR